MSDRKRIWSTLEKTDPAHTKGFQRSGGFKGTAVRPIYSDLRMTEAFGPCGIGWGITEPQYQLVTTADGAVLVYCTVGVWYVDPETGARSEPIPGVGGDFAVAKRQSGAFPDDEAFKKAFTDAVGNATKRLGMSADVHMGMFDDHKYVAELRREKEADKAPPQQAPANAAAAERDPKAIADAIIDRVHQTTTARELEVVMASGKIGAALAWLHEHHAGEYGAVMAYVTSHKSNIAAAA